LDLQAPVAVSQVVPGWHCESAAQTHLPLVQVPERQSVGTAQLGIGRAVGAHVDRPGQSPSAPQALPTVRHGVVAPLASTHGVKADFPTNWLLSVQTLCAIL
jgi:hypothetical protein